MAKFNTENSSTLSRFAKDKRVRTAEPKRKSYNPHFTDDNRLKEPYSSRNSEEPTMRTGFSKRTVKPVRGSKPTTSRGFNSDSQEGRGFGKSKSFGNKPQGKSFGSRSEGGYKGKPSGKSFGERTEGRWVGIAPFSKQEGKTYPSPLREQLVELAAGEFDRVFIFSGGGAEREFAGAMESRYENVTAVFGRIRLDEEVNLMANLDAMVSMDSTYEYRQ